MTPRPSARFCLLLFIASGIGVFVISHRLSSWRMALLVAAAKRSQSHFLSSLKKAERLMLTRLQTEVFSLSWGSVISVHRLEWWIVPVLLLRALTLIVSFQVNQGWEVACKIVRIWWYCSLAGIFEKSRS